MFAHFSLWITSNFEPFKDICLGYPSKQFEKSAFKADDKLYAISSNPSLTIEQKGQQIQTLYQSLPANVRQELESIEGPQGQGR